MEMPVDLIRQDVILLAAVRAVPMRDQPKVLEYVQRSIDS
jgi:hypothetical protein